MPTGHIPPDARPPGRPQGKPESDQTSGRQLPRTQRAETRDPDSTSDLTDIVSAGRGFYDRDSVRRWLDIDDSDIDAGRRTHTLLVLSDGSGQEVLPAWQFGADGQQIAFLADVLRALSRGIADPWTWALWLTSPLDEGRSAVDVLSEGGDPRPVLETAQRDASRWRQ